MLILLNAVLFISTIYYWVQEVELDMHRNKDAENAMDLTSWEIIQTVPTMGYLSLCYLFLADI